MASVSVKISTVLHKSFVEKWKYSPFWVLIPHLTSLEGLYLPLQLFFLSIPISPSIPYDPTPPQTLGSVSYPLNYSVHSWPWSQVSYFLGDHLPPASVLVHLSHKHLFGLQSLLRSLLDLFSSPLPSREFYSSLCTEFQERITFAPTCLYISSY